MISFQGFKPSGIEKIANAMGFQGEEKDFKKFLEENPDRQAEMLRYQDIARKMVEGGYVRKLSGGAYVLIKKDQTIEQNKLKRVNPRKKLFRHNSLKESQILKYQQVQRLIHLQYLQMKQDQLIPTDLDR